MRKIIFIIFAMALGILAANAQSIIQYPDGDHYYDPSINEVISYKIVNQDLHGDMDYVNRYTDTINQIDSGNFITKDVTVSAVQSVQADAQALAQQNTLTPSGVSTIPRQTETNPT